MKKILLASFICFATVAVSAQTNANTVSPSGTTTAAPEGLAVNEMIYDFGKIPQGKPVTHQFIITNTSTAAYKLDNVQASCGCTTPQWDKEKMIAPGETAIITVGYNAASEGPFTKPVTITYNGTHTKVLNIKGEVWKTPATPAPASEGVSDLKN
ncbi:MAG: hypothetical protein ABS68_12110 [Niastella sp. SCN 39-18]|nr:DUF1573 domain-containing protein [Sphingobacteriales bacterium]ODT51703.1 MAG: hypothetical protein ABS68_12110 [Niastella sp. SCN 39-18]OJW09731.1 MAG: hypothetical protein BGO53_07715 [Sphingobacteriales bacterium 39-19]